ncbi:glycoside hydrolase [Gorgonomyces haynaldii]|nr:glycoside hydrolase [Gorgonomyces haynaldii]
MTNKDKVLRGRPSTSFTESFVEKHLSYGQDSERLQHIVNMTLHAWNGYTKYAWGTDELLPFSRKGANWAMDASLLFTPVDSLDTLYIMDLKQEYQQAKELVLEKLDFKVEQQINVFETTIRILGGLLSAYDLDGDERLLTKAKHLGDLLLKAFQPNGLPHNNLHLMTGQATGSSVSIATAGTLQLEFQYLSDVTGDPKYQNAALKTFDIIHAMPKEIPGLTPKFIDMQQTEFSRPYGYGAGGEADSYFEYELKMWLSTKEERYRKWYDESADGFLKHLVVYDNDGKFAYLPDYNPSYAGMTKENKFHHLTCFAGGMLSTGALTQRTGNWIKHLDLAAKITETCYQCYFQNTEGVAGEFCSVSGDKISSDSKYELRPETVESLFYMWRYTHDPKYREWGWHIVQKLEKHCRDEIGYHSLQYGPRDKMESFFLAETLKYLYLLFSEDSVIPLDEYVFNTEAHPFSIRGYGRRKDPSKWLQINKSFL